MKRFICAAAIAASFILTVAAPAAAEWPADRPIHVIVGFGAGGGTDIVSRIIAQPLSELLKQSIVVENKVGAGGTLAASRAGHQPAATLAPTARASAIHASPGRNAADRTVEAK